ncbi:hypothetical protein [Phyllobacterium sp. SB3]|uniref:hypothetical protein n=1 Tax=Phyllobacterium sp. SB3 TaxID=3156073 RepID=UPI0032AE8E77
MTFLNEGNPNYSKSEGELMQRALDLAAEKLGIPDENSSERNSLMRFVRAAFIIGNRDVNAIASFTVDAILIRRKNAHH